jgi:hypothetical protein
MLAAVGLRSDSVERFRAEASSCLIRRPAPSATRRSEGSRSPQGAASRTRCRRCLLSRRRRGARGALWASIRMARKNSPSTTGSPLDARGSAWSCASRQGSTREPSGRLLNRNGRLPGSDSLTSAETLYSPFAGHPRIRRQVIGRRPRHEEAKTIGTKRNAASASSCAVRSRDPLTDRRNQVREPLADTECTQDSVRRHSSGRRTSSDSALCGSKRSRPKSRAALRPSISPHCARARYAIASWSTTSTAASSSTRPPQAARISPSATSTQPPRASRRPPRRR